MTKLNYEQIEMGDRIMFETGEIVPTKLVLTRAKGLNIDLMRLIQMHSECNWPDNTTYERALNAEAIEKNTNIYARYALNGSIFIIHTDLKEGKTHIKMVEEV